MAILHYFKDKKINIEFIVLFYFYLIKVQLIKLKN
jgi:hypothetical protein